MADTRHNTTRRQILASGAVVTGAMIAGCLGDNGEEETGEIPPIEEHQYDREHPDDEEAARESTLHFTQGAVRAEEHDPISSQNGESRLVWNNVFDFLYEWDEHLSLEPKVATSMPEVERDGQRYLIEIHDGIEFHNGDELTASDVVYSFIAPVEEQTAIAAQYDMIESADVIDDHQLQIDLAYPSGRFTTDTLRTAIVPEEAREADPDGFESDPVGSGPFLWADFEYNEYVELERWEDYWDEPMPYLQSIRFEAVDDDANRVSQIRSDDTDLIMEVPDNDWEVLEDEEDVRLHRNRELTYQYLAFNCKEEAGTSDRDVRRGIAHSFSMQDWIEQHVPYTAERTVSPVLPVLNEEWGFPHDEWEEELYPEYDPELAEELLDEAAPDDWNPTFISGPGASSNLIEEIALRLGELGYDVDVQVLDIPSLVEQIYGGDPDDFEMYASAISGAVDPDGTIYRLLHESQEGVSQGHFYQGSDDFHTKMEQARQTADQEERFELYSDVIEEVLEELPMLPAYGWVRTFATKERVRDVQTHPEQELNPRIGSEYGNIWIDN